MTTSGEPEAWPPPSPARSAPAQPARSVRPASSPFGSFRAALEWWLRPLVESRTWVSFGSLFVGIVVGPVLFAVTITIIAVVFGLMFALIGVLLVVPAFVAIDAIARWERSRAAWVGPTIPARPLRPVGRAGLQSIAIRLGDPARWRQVAYLSLGVVLGPLYFFMGLGPWLVVALLVTDVDRATPSIAGGWLSGVVGAVAGLVAAGGAARLTRFVAALAASTTAWFLGPDPTADLEERVVELSSQREQILDAVADERRRIERNLHDGVQQQLVALGIDIGRASSRVDTDPAGAKELLDDATSKVRGAIGELRLIGRGLHPAVLSDRGLDAAISSIVANAPIPISVEMSTSRELPADVAETAYYVVNEGVANVLKHARARSASVRVEDDPGLLPAVRITIYDDGRGGADRAASTGGGLPGIAARVEGVDGGIEIRSPIGGPTELIAVIPIRRERGTVRDVEPGEAT